MIHVLEDTLYRKTSVWLVIIFHVEQFYACSALIFLLRTSSQHLNLFFFFSSSFAHRLIHNLQGQFMHMHMFQQGALSRNAPQHVEKDTSASQPTANRLFWWTAGSVILKTLYINEPSVLCFHGVWECDVWKELHSQLQCVCVVIFRWETFSSTI